ITALAEVQVADDKQVVFSPVFFPGPSYRVDSGHPPRRSIPAIGVTDRAEATPTPRRYGGNGADRVNGSRDPSRIQRYGEQTGIRPNDAGGESALSYTASRPPASVPRVLPAREGAGSGPMPMRRAWSHAAVGRSRRPILRARSFPPLLRSGPAG